MSADSAYDRLSALAGEIHAFRSSLSLLWWDEETGMPPKAISWRARQTEALSAHAHRLSTSGEFGDLLARCEDEEQTHGTTRAVNLRLWRENYDRNRKLPASFVAEEASVGTHARTAWAAARARNDFPAFLPWLEKQVELRRRKVDYLGYEEHPYDALLNLYERGMKTREAAAVLGDLQKRLVDFLPAALDHAKSVPAGLLDGEYPVRKQTAFNREVLAALGFDFEAGRLDTTTHPFCSRITPGDVRLTTRYNERDFTDAFFGCLHEMGHGLYEQGLPEDEATRPVGQSVSLGVHESQSRLWENHVGRSPEFWEKWLPVAAKYFPHLARRTPGEMSLALNRAEPGFIRVDSDESTYDLHICLRFGIELDLITGDLAPRDLPGEWNRRFKELTGLDVPDDRRGCLQDIHWAMGAIGYFATYSLGNLLAAQLMETARRNPAIAAACDRADYAPLLGWLRDHIHAPGSIHPPGELILRATGKPLAADAFLAHLRRRYTR